MGPSASSCWEEESSVRMFLEMTRKQKTDSDVGTDGRAGLWRFVKRRRRRPPVGLESSADKVRLNGLKLGRMMRASDSRTI